MMLAATVGGGLGACLRYVVDRWIRGRWATELPWATLAINVSGSFVLGLLVMWLPSGTLLAFLGTGLMGGYTTFSTASVDSVTQKTPWQGGFYAAATVVLAVAAAWLGLLIAS